MRISLPLRTFEASFNDQWKPSIYFALTKSAKVYFCWFSMCQNTWNGHTKSTSMFVIRAIRYHQLEIQQQDSQKPRKGHEVSETKSKCMFSNLTVRHQSHEIQPHVFQTGRDILVTRIDLSQKPRMSNNVTIKNRTVVGSSGGFLVLMFFPMSVFFTQGSCFADVLFRWGLVWCRVLFRQGLNCSKV